MIKTLSTPSSQFEAKLWVGLICGVVILMLCLMASIGLGAADIDWGMAYRALVAYDGSTDHIIIRTVRVPRSLVGMLVGAALAVSGAIMQGLTRNPLASPSILGVNAGAAFSVVLAVFVLGAESLNTYAWFGLFGAGLAAVSVYFLGSLGPGGLTPLNLTIAGAAFTALTSSLTTAILVLSQQTLDEIRFWLAGSVAGRDIELLIQVLPYLVTGLILSLFLAKQITLLSLGEDVAKGLGQQTALVKALAGVAVVLLAGGSVAVAGPIGFIGLIIPHMVRFVVGPDYRWILPYAAIAGAVLLLLADIIARLIIQPQELPVGGMMPLLGAPFFVYLIRRKLGK